MTLKTLELRVADYMSPKPLAVRDDSSLLNAIQIMEDKNIGNLIVEKHHKPIGILTERQILEHLSIFKKIKDVTLKEVKINSFEVVSLDTRVIDAARLMIKNKSRLIVLDAKRLIGIITATDMVRAFRRTAANPDLSNVQSTRLYTVKYDDTIFTASKLMYKKRIGSVIVLKNKKTYGIFTERDLLVNVLPFEVKLSQPVGGYRTTPLVTSSSGIKGGDACKMMSKNKIKRLVLTQNKKLYSIVTTRDIVESFVTSFSI